MRLAEKLVNKVIYLQILLRTDSDEILRTYVQHSTLFNGHWKPSRFLRANGQRILLNWLSDVSVEENRAFLLDVLTTLGHLPLHLELSPTALGELQVKIGECASPQAGKDVGQGQSESSPF